MTGFGHRPPSHGEGRPSAKSMWSSTVPARSSKVSDPRPSPQRSRPPGLSAKHPNLSARPTGYRAAKQVLASPSTGTIINIYFDFLRIQKNLKILYYNNYKLNYLIFYFILKGMD